jgi:hypothetical protein
LDANCTNLLELKRGTGKIWPQKDAEAGVVAQLKVQNSKLKMQEGGKNATQVVDFSLNEVEWNARAGTSL